MTAFLTKFFAFLISILVGISNLTGWGKGEIVPNKNGSLACVDSLGREIVSSGGSSEKQVGVFYFLWLETRAKLCDNTKLVAEHPDAINSVENWMTYGGLPEGEFHFWGEPLFGYYISKDKWVLGKHLQMLTDAGVDFIFFDTTKGYSYSEVVYNLIDVWYKYLLQGWDVPQIAFYSAATGKAVNKTYDEFYNNAELKAKYPRLDELWYKWDNKPLIIGSTTDSELRDDVKSYFRIKASQWPTRGKKIDGFPWIEFDRSLTYQAIYGTFIGDSIMSVSVAQHTQGFFSSTAWYGGNSRSRSWHNGANDTSPNAPLYGYNFTEQWDFAMLYNPDVIFVTSFNEWVAQRNKPTATEPIRFVDTADFNNSRDIEPMNGMLGDNYYMQFVNYVAKFKRTATIKVNREDVSIDMSSGFEQWNNSKISARYQDYTGDTVDRDSAGAEVGLQYTDTSGRNDINTMKVAKDSHYLYFYVDTVDTLKAVKDENTMNLLLSVDKTNPNKNGYNFRIIPYGSDGKAQISKYTGTGFEVVGEADMVENGNQIMLRVSRNLLGLENEKVNIQFKWTDNCDFNDLYSFYTKGESAPLGRLNYTFSE
ncbi:MAG: hypothetical protein WCN92_08045 [Eubacteriales bacterium]